MEELTKAGLIALAGLISALLTQIGLRWDQTRRETRLRLLHDLRGEQSLLEGIAYKSRNLIFAGVPKNDTRSLDAHIDEALFGEVYRESNVVTLCGELEAFGVVLAGYSKEVHTYRDKCFVIVKKALAPGSTILPQCAVKEIRFEIKKISGITKVVTKGIHHRFTWLESLKRVFQFRQGSPGVETDQA